MAQVIVYTKNACPKCTMTKSVLEGEGVEFKLVNIEETDSQGNLTDDAKEGYDFVVNVLGVRSMPVVVKDGFEPIVGFEPDKLKALKG